MLVLVGDPEPEHHTVLLAPADPVRFIPKDLGCYDAAAGLICRPVAARDSDALINVSDLRC